MSSGKRSTETNALHFHRMHGQVEGPDTPSAPWTNNELATDRINKAHGVLVGDKSGTILVRTGSVGGVRVPHMRKGAEGRSMSLQKHTARHPRSTPSRLVTRVYGNPGRPIEPQQWCELFRHAGVFADDLFDGLKHPPPKSTTDEEIVTTPTSAVPPCVPDTGRNDLGSGKCPAKINLLYFHRMHGQVDVHDTSTAVWTNNGLGRSQGVHKTHCILVVNRAIPSKLEGWCRDVPRRSAYPANNSR